MEKFWYLFNVASQKRSILLTFSFSMQKERQSLWRKKAPHFRNCLVQYFLENECFQKFTELFQITVWKLDRFFANKRWDSIKFYEKEVLSRQTAEVSLKNKIPEWKKKVYMDRVSSWFRLEAPKPNKIWKFTLHEKWCFPLRNPSVNVTKSAVFCRFGHIYWRNP